MNRLVNFVLNTSSRWVKKQGKLLLDFGSGSAKFYLDGNLIETRNSAIPNYKQGNLDELHLVERGTIIDFEGGKNFLNQVLRKLVNEKRIWPRFDGYYLLPSDSSQVDQIIVKKILNSLDYGSWQLVKKSQVARAKGGCVIDIGFDLTEIILGFGGGKQEAKTLKIGSRSFTNTIREVVREKYQLDVSWQVADRVKREIVGKDFLLSTEKNTQKITIRGKDIYTFVPKTVTINAVDLQNPLLEIANDFFEDLKLYFSQISTDLLMNSIEEGVELWGEGSKLAGFENFLAQKLQTRVNLSQAHYEV
ncbi:rod shape-determining protein [Patescibacteria group bacterium]|nr:rod shape-determining protein [Patescibacteria group bacterium]